MIRNLLLSSLVAVGMSSCTVAVMAGGLAHLAAPVIAAPAR